MPDDLLRHHHPYQGMRQRQRRHDQRSSARARQAGDRPSGLPTSSARSRPSCNQRSSRWRLFRTPRLSADIERRQRRQDRRQQAFALALDQTGDIRSLAAFAGGISLRRRVHSGGIDARMPDNPAPPRLSGRSPTASRCIRIRRYRCQRQRATPPASPLSNPTISRAGRTRAGLHHMHHHIAEIDQRPLRVDFPFDAERHASLPPPRPVRSIACWPDASYDEHVVGDTDVVRTSSRCSPLSCLPARPRIPCFLPSFALLAGDRLASEKAARAGCNQHPVRQAHIAAASDEIADACRKFRSASPGRRTPPAGARRLRIVDQTLRSSASSGTAAATSSPGRRMTTRCAARSAVASGSGCRARGKRPCRRSGTAAHSHRIPRARTARYRRYRKARRGAVRGHRRRSRPGHRSRSPASPVAAPRWRTACRDAAAPGTARSEADPGRALAAIPGHSADERGERDRRCRRGCRS